MDDKTNSDLKVSLYVYPGLAPLAQDKLCGHLTIENANFPIYSLSFKTILEIASRVFQIDEDMIKGKNRAHGVVRARTAYLALAIHFLPKYTLTQIGGYVNRHHTSVTHNRVKHHNWMEVYPEYAALYKRAEYQCSKYFIYENVDNNSSG